MKSGKGKTGRGKGTESLKIVGKLLHKGLEINNAIVSVSLPMTHIREGWRRQVLRTSKSLVLNR